MVMMMARVSMRGMVVMMMVWNTAVPWWWVRREAKHVERTWAIVDWVMVVVVVMMMGVHVVVMVRSMTCFGPLGATLEIRCLGAVQSVAPISPVTRSFSTATRAGLASGPVSFDLCYSCPHQVSAFEMARWA